MLNSSSLDNILFRSISPTSNELKTVQFTLNFSGRQRDTMSTAPSGVSRSLVLSHTVTL